MPKPRSKRQAIREERKQKRQDKDNAALEEKSSKRRRINDHGDAEVTALDDSNQGFGGADGFVLDVDGARGAAARPELEFFGMLSEEEQEYFRSVDEQLDIDDFESQEDRDNYLANVFTEAQGKELKLACSQSCSRLMERLILMSNTRQKKHLFNQFGGHFLNLIQHRFASHCCETLFLQSAPIVTKELSGERDDQPVEGEEDGDDKQLPFMEELFLLTLDELEGQLSYLLTEKFASHTLRVFLIILSGRPLQESNTKSLIHSKRKEKISAPWMAAQQTELNTQVRAVPAAFSLAAKKIIADSTEGMTPTELRVLATHPTGNPVLQLFLELDISLASNTTEKEAGETGEAGDGITLLWQLLPGAPASLKDSSSPATELVNSLLYEPIGSRLLETLITHCPGKLFKVLNKHVLGSRVPSLLRNDIACYPAIRVLTRLSKEDLVATVKNTIPEIPKLLSLSRYNVIKTLFERCHVRQARDEIGALTRALVDAVGGDPKSLVPTLCQLNNNGAEDAQKSDKKGSGKKDASADPYASKNRAALVSHGSHLVTSLLAIPGPPCKAIQKSLPALSADQLYDLATSSGPTSHVLVDALATPSENKAYHKCLVTPLRARISELALSDHGNKVACAIVSVPSKSANNGSTLPFHFKESVMAQLGEHERELRDSYQGRKVWREWKGDLWRNRRHDWVAWAKEVDEEQQPKKPGETESKTSGGGKNARSHHPAAQGANGTTLGPRKRGRDD